MPRYSLKRSPWWRITSPGALVGAGEQRAEHDRVGAGGDRLGDVAGAAHAAVGDDRDVVPRARPGDSRRSPSPAGTPTPATIRVVQMLPGPMPALDGVGPGVDQRLGRLGGRDVAGDELDVAEPLQLSHHLEHRLASVRAPCRRRGRPTSAATSACARSTASAAHADGGADAQPAALVLARVRVLDLLLDVLDGDQALEEARPRPRPAASRSCCGGGSPPPPPAWCRPARSRGRGWSSAPRPSARRRSRSGGRGW